MKVILTSDVRGVGKKDEVKQVADGYARNFLLPQNLARPATDKAVEKIEDYKKQKMAQTQAAKEEALKIANRLQGVTVQIEVPAAEGGSIFGSVNSTTIQKILRSKGFLGPERVQVNLPHPIKAVGDYLIEVEFHKGTVARFKLAVRAQP